MVSERIKELRESNKYTQTDLAKELGLSRSAVNAWEMGVSVPSTQYLVQIAKLFKVTTDYLLGFDPEETVNLSFLSPDEKEIIYDLVNRFRAHHTMAKELSEYRKAYTSVKPVSFDTPLPANRDKKHKKNPDD